MINRQVTIIDRPRFRHRGVMLDTARHFLPVPIIKKNLVSFRNVHLNFLWGPLRMSWLTINWMSFIGTSSMINHFHLKAKPILTYHAQYALIIVRIIVPFNFINREHSHQIMCTHQQMLRMSSNMHDCWVFVSSLRFVIEKFSVQLWFDGLNNRLTLLVIHIPGVRLCLNC